MERLSGLVHERRIGHQHCERVKEGVCGQSQPQPLETRRQKPRQAMNPAGNGHQSLGPMVSRVGHGHVGQECLSRANVRGRLLASDMLLTGPERQAQGGASAGILRDTHQAPRHGSFERISSRKISRMRTTKTQRDSKALSATNGNIGAPFARSFQQRQCEQVCSEYHQSPCLVGCPDQLRIISHLARAPWVLNQDTEYLGPERGLAPITHHDLQAQRLGPCPHQIDILRMAVRSDPERVAIGIRLFDTTAQGHRLRACCGLVQK